MDHLDVVRGWVLTMLVPGRAGAVLARRADLGDREAWEAIGAELRADYRGCRGVCEALGAGDLDGAVARAAMVCGDYEQVDDEAPVPMVETWLRETRAELARKGGV